MKLLVVGASYRTAPVATLERLAVSPSGLDRTLGRLVAQPYVSEAVLVSTCNRVEVYAAVSGFHGGLGDICAILAEQAGCQPAALANHLYVHFDSAAVDHVFRVAAGLDSMVIGEAQILGQLRDAYHWASAADTAGRLLHELMQQALRVGKRAHSETGIDRAGQSVVTAALGLAAGHLDDDLTGRPALIVGAGAMGSLGVATLSRLGAGPLTVANRSTDRAVRLAESYGAGARPMAELAETLSTVDIVVAATASTEPVLTREVVAAAAADRDPGRGPLVLLDLAVPRDVGPGVAELPGVEVIDIDRMAALLADGPVAADAAAVERIVAGEVESFLSWLRGADVAPTVAALRGRADDVVTAELRRLAQRRPDLSDDQRAEVARTVHRVVQRLLHQPTVRVRQLAAEPGGDQYTALLRELFDLEVPQTSPVDTVPDITPPTGGER
ncbi:glutamyl-tRNA reductase [Verrucosispora sp. WMMD703]|uniref:Glutamyl-tRNA reductase n=1 Tax=Micromonospora sediminimaris TaxID=547162 RepID=A0A9W5XJX3_9ACTN|nr:MULTISPECIES: glutamyl-tRNA reductase [Micromonospora]WFE46259.1 glutamyl-tRNA reductase [Verrucosispora sp. WMMD1129]GIJ32118.1 glutamyl-tRNA reductase [Micromonospora sediminimaris]SFC67364.1 glutamyl-tRNA reductase [Micromonospora sediminimaris]